MAKAFHRGTHQDIAARMDEVEAAVSPTNVLHANDGQAPPNGTTWIRASQIDGEGTQAEVGVNGQRQTTGILSFSIFLPEGVGDGAGRELADKIADVFRNNSTDKTWFRESTLEVVGRSGPWWQLDLTVPYLYRTSL